MFVRIDEVCSTKYFDIAMTCLQITCLIDYFCMITFKHTPPKQIFRIVVARTVLVNIVSVANHYENTLTTFDIHIQTSEHAFILRKIEYRKVSMENM